MALTLTEKQHWKNRIDSKLGRRIRELRESEPELISRFQEAALKDVRAGLDHDFSRLEELEALQASTDEAVATALREIYEKLTGESEERADRWTIDRKLDELRAERFEEFLRDSELGKRVTELENRREELTDEILLATNIQQIIDAWEEVTRLISDRTSESESETESESDQVSLFEKAA